MIPISVFIRLTVAATVGVILSLLTGCATTSPLQPPLAPTIVTKYQLVKPGAVLLADCDIKSIPPDPETFAGKQFPTEVERLRFQLGQTANYAAALQTDLKNCNSRPRVLRDWFANEDLLYPATP